MIDRTQQLAPPPQAAPLRVRPAAGRSLVLLVVFVCAACGLVYELELVALASYLIGDSVTQASVVLSVMVFAMGVGSLLAKRLRCRAAVGFGLLELSLALIGGCSALVLYASFAWGGGSRLVLVSFSLIIGVLIGAELPLLMSLIQRVSRRDRDVEGTVADLFAVDYVGALVGGLAFPFLLLPWLGRLTSGLLTGAVNAVVGGLLVLCLFRHDLTRRSRLWLLVANAAVLAVLGTATVLVDDFERAARRAVYGDRVRVALETDVQEVVLTGGPGGPLDLFLDGRLWVSEGDERRYHEALVHPAMRGPHTRVLIIGGGDGLAAREVLRYRGAASVTVAELDPVVVRLARTDPALTALNRHAYRDPRVRVVTGDAFGWLRSARSEPVWDVVIVDLPEPGTTRSAKFYSQEFYGLLGGALADGGRLVVHAGPSGTRPRTYWTVEATLRAAGFRATAYRADGGLSRLAAGPEREGRATMTAPCDWGFLLAAHASAPRLGLDSGAPPLTSLTPGRLAADARETALTRVPALAPSTLVHPRYEN
ncbi:polyamine aminopropyltransferase [Streptomyces clavuligerus]|uniref:Polyamine aminopropyltransferase n=1 Tax=Streptomyces clavuligerus TaxID=1901 RepID=B5GTC9_STRCL|nr:polyamine aminopropyltransferase [Streptomyces clavuligerus]ANW19475.1 spermidine synthase [Streptomyces clavuligerus]AXU14083.1 polyamine aminopropyltransferase [Streptomyces clavuligerus]EDY49610.1 spermidine synthase [Streptomyces clavuligerus]EFG07724.1 Spermidine synthase [Streptomyces clavuligerus]MBY6304068.1 polyamine aminopropyltransferase [Streptomyces clavuligerus]